MNSIVALKNGTLRCATPPSSKSRISIVPTKRQTSHSRSKRCASFQVVSVSTASTDSTVSVGKSNDEKLDCAVRELEALYPKLPHTDILTNLRLLFALPWRRFKSGSALTIKLGGKIAEQPQSRFSSTTSIPAICDSLVKAAYDPRVCGLVVKIDPLDCGWGKLQEIRRHIEYFKSSGKWTIAYCERAGEKEYYLASAFAKIYAPPSASLSLRGFSVSGSFLRGALDKVGIEPEVRRIGKFKSAGDQLLRLDMSEAQREQLSTLLDDIYNEFLETIAKARGKTAEEVKELLDRGVYDMETFLRENWVDGLKYEDELNDIVCSLTKGTEDELRVVGLKKYSRVNRSAFGLDGGNKTIAVVRTSGAIVAGGGSTGMITASSVISQLRAIKKDKRIAAVVLRIDSPGGDALASDLMWREIKKLSETKPVIASMSDVAASGGYYMAMACQKIVAESLTLTGSIGVVTGKFSLRELYEKIGFNKETISRGRFAELLLETRKFNDDEAALFDSAAQYAYTQFRNKAAASRGMSQEDMETVAQGRVWSGRRGETVGLVDAVGGVSKAIALARDALNIAEQDKVRIKEVSRASLSPLALLQMGSVAAAFKLFMAMALQDLSSAAAVASAFRLVSDLSERSLIDDLVDSVGNGTGTKLMLPKGLSVEAVSSVPALAQTPYPDNAGTTSELFID